MNKNKLSNLINETELKIFPINQAETIPSTWYTEKIIYEFEIDHLFNQSWQCIGHVNQLHNVGDYILFELFDNPLIIIKDDKENLQSFYNVCKHRGGPLAIEPGNTKLLQCKYHGWTYKLDGSLHKHPKFEDVENFDKNDFCLNFLNTIVWEGLIFIALENPAVRLSDLLSGIKDKIAPIDINKYNFYRRVEYPTHCNWKVYIDNFLEGYHLPFVHPGLSKVLNAKEYITETSEHYSLQYSPLQVNEIYGSGEAFYYFIFPNIMLNILPGRLQTNLVLPVSKNKSLVIFDYYIDDTTSSESIKRIEVDITFSDEVQKEDIYICEKVQRGLESKGYDKGRFSPKEEMGVYHFQSMLKKYYHRFVNEHL